MVKTESQTQTVQIELESLKAELAAAEVAVEATRAAVEEAISEESQSQMQVV
jgi:hypothetical protein